MKRSEIRRKNRELKRANKHNRVSRDGGRPGPAVPGQSARELAALVKSGIDCLQQNKPQAAEQIFRQVLMRDPRHGDANHMMGVLAFQYGQLKAAIEFFDVAIATSPRVAFYYNNKAAALKDLGQFDAAAENCQKALDLEPNFIDALFNLGNICNGQGAFDAAETILKKALLLDSNNPEVMRSIGLALQGRGQYSEAIVWFENAIAVNPDFAAAHNDLGISLLENGDPAAAAIRLQKSIDLQPQVAGTYINLGKALHRCGRFEQAVACFQKSLDLHPDFAPAYNNWGTLYQDVGRYEEAAEKFQKAIDLVPDLAAAHNNLGNVKNSLAKPQEAISSFERALLLDPGNADFLSNLGATFRDLGDYNQALTCFQRADGAAKDAAISAMCLECYYLKSDLAGFRNQLRKIQENQNFNFRAAAASEFVAHQMRTENTYPFCENPVDLVSPYRVPLNAAAGGGLLADISESIRDQDWDEQFAPGHITAGYRSVGNIFDKQTSFSVELETIIRDQVAQFYEKHKTSPYPMIKQWPKTYDLFGWYIRLMRGGEITAHVHQGWLSGVFYVRLPEKGAGDEGNIEFSLRGYDLPAQKEDYPTLTVQTEPGLLVLFPSSLPHRVIPFSADFERQCVAFDIMPVRDD